MPARQYVKLCELNDFEDPPLREMLREIVPGLPVDEELHRTSFDFVLCLSSIEHFGGPKATVRAAAEMARVVRPGGRVVITTECFVGRHPLNSPKLQFAIRVASLGRRCSAATPTKRMIDAFTPREIGRLIVRPMAERGVQLTQPLDTKLSAESRENLIRWVGAGELHPATGSLHPHILLQAHGSPWTSAFLAFHKRS